MSSFSDLKRSSSDSFEKLNKELSKLNAPANERTADDRLWSCKTDKAGNGYAVIRFLPAPGGEDVPFIRMFTHGFKGPAGQWYIENCLSTVGNYDSDPVNQMNSQLWNSGIEANKKIVQGQGREKPGTKRQLNYYSNIYVVKDPANPDNEGKVFLFRYGSKIFDHLKDLMTPQFEDESPIDPFNLWTGANFKLKIRKVDGYTNYDKSEFEPAGPLFDDDDKLEKIWKSEYSLKEIIDPKHFKSFDDLKKRLDMVMGNTIATPTRKAVTVDEDEGLPWEPTPQQKAAPARQQPAAEEEDDEDFAFFNSLKDD